MSARFRCPQCHGSTGEELYAVVTVDAWVGLDDHLEMTGDRDHEGWHTAQETGEMGCSCGWLGIKDGLEQIGTDGEPLPVVIPGQLVIEDS